MKTKTLLDEWKNFLNKEMINEVSFKRFQEQYQQFDTSRFTSQLKGNTDYLDIISNSINAGQNHSSDDFIQQFEFYKNSIEPNRHRQDFLTINIPGEDESISLSGKLNQGSCTATYDDIQQFQQARTYVLGKGNKRDITSLYASVISNADVNDFEFVTENDSWIIFYPKTIRGSIALARSYWDGAKVSYDETFNPSRGFGQNTGNIRWCTSISGSGNMFLNYHRRLNLHMYYCINKSTRSIEDPLRKLCISLSKKSKPRKEIKFYGNFASVNANNTPLTEEKAKKHLGNLFDNLLKDASQEKRLEIDIESYYRSISLDQYIALRNANEENISQFLDEVRSIVDYSKESKEILNHIVNDSNPVMRAFAAGRHKTPSEVLVSLAQDESEIVRDRIARNSSTPTEVLVALAQDPSENVRDRIARNSSTPTEVLVSLTQDPSDNVRNSSACNSNIPTEVLVSLAQGEDLELKRIVAGHPKTPPKVLVALAQDKDTNVRCRLAMNRVTPPKVLVALAQDPSAKVREYLARNNNAPPKVLVALAQDEVAKVKSSVANNDNTPPEALAALAQDEDLKLKRFVASHFNAPPEVLLALAQVEDTQIKRRVAMNDNTPPEALEILVKDKSAEVRACVAENYEAPQKILALLAQDKSAKVRNNLVYNPNISQKILKILANDKNGSIRDKAISRLDDAKNKTLLRRFINLIIS